MSDEPTEPKVVERVVERVVYVRVREEREPPTTFDPLATYDALWRKVPKRIFGFLEACRAVPGYAGAFSREVPSTSFVVQEDDLVAVRCMCEAVTYVPQNGVEDCEGECGRTFAAVVGPARLGRARVLVARADNS